MSIVRPVVDLPGGNALNLLEPSGGDGIRFPGINALRAVAALSVVAFHVNVVVAPLPRHNPVSILVASLDQGVGLFFVISGFVLWRPFAAALLARRSVSISSYARNRVLRIVPLYLLLIATTVIFDSSARTLPAIARSLSFGWVYEGVRPFAVSVTWSVDDEVIYYVLMPILFIACALIGTKVGAGTRGPLAFGLVVALLVISVAYQLVVFVLLKVDILRTNGTSALSLNPLSMFFLFGCGMLLAHVRSTNNARVRNFATFVNGFGVFVVATGGGIVLIHFFPRVLYFFPPLSEVLLGIGCAALLAAIVWSTPTSWIVRVLSIAPIVFLGELSFGIYMWHMSVIQLLDHLGLLPRNFAVALVLIAALTIAFAALTYLLVERPALSLKRFWASPQVSSSKMTTPRLRRHGAK